MEHRLFVNMKKCHFLTTQVLFLGFIICQKGISIDNNKIRAIGELPTLATVTQARSFLGLTTFYWRFIRHFSTIVAPFTYFLQWGWFDWGLVADAAFSEIKRKLTTAPIIPFPTSRTL